MLSMSTPKSYFQTVDLSTPLPIGYGYQANGEAPGDLTGTSLAKVTSKGGKPNNILIGSDHSATGATYQINGIKGLRETLELGSLGSAGITYIVSNPYNWIHNGWAVTSLDFDRDGETDTVISSLLDCRARVIRGGKGTGNNGNPVLLNNLNSTTGFEIIGNPSQALCPYSFCKVDVNGDGNEDLIWGSNLANYNGVTYDGAVFVIISRPDIGKNGSETLVALNGTTGFRIDGEAYSGSRLGMACGVTSSTNGTDKLVVAAPLLSKPGLNFTGAAYVLKGETPFNATQNMAALLNNEAIKLTGWQPSQSIATSIQTEEADYNGDGYGDLVLALRGAQGSSNSSVCIKWGPYFENSDFNPSIPQNNVTCFPGLSHDVQSAFVDTAGDFNKDGVDDLLICEPYASPDNRTEAGVCHIIRGGSHLKLNSIIDKSNSSYSIQISGGKPFDHFGSIARSVGDVNGDETDDIMICAPEASPHGKLNAGSCVTIYGDVSPVLNSVSVHVPDGDTIHFNSSNINVTDANHPSSVTDANHPSSFTYVLANVKNGYFFLANDPNNPPTPISNFTQAQLDADIIRIKSTNHLPFSFEIGVNTTGLAYLPPQPAPNVTWSKTIPPEITMATIRHTDGQPPILINEQQNINGSSVYADQNHTSIKFFVEFQNYKFTSRGIDPITNQTIQYPITNGTLGDLSHNMTYGNLIGNGLPSGQLTLTDDAGLSSTTPFNFETFRVTENHVPGLVGADPNHVGTPVCYPLTVNNLNTSINFPGSDPNKVRFDFPSGNNVQISLNGSSQAVSSVTQKDIMDGTYCVVSTANEIPQLNFTSTDPASGAQIGPVPINFGGFVYTPDVEKNDFKTGSNILQQGTRKVITTDMLSVSDRNVPPTPYPDMRIKLLQSTDATFCTTYGTGTTCTPLSLPVEINQGNISAGVIYIRPGFTPTWPTATAQACSAKACTDPFPLNIGFEVTNPEPILFPGSIQASPGADRPLVAALTAISYVIDPQGNLVLAPTSVQQSAQICWKPGKDQHHIIYDVQTNRNLKPGDTPIPIAPSPSDGLACTDYNNFQSYTHIRFDSNDTKPSLSFLVQSAAGVPNRNGLTEIPVDWTVTNPPPIMPGQVLKIARDEIVPLILQGSSENDNDNMVTCKVDSVRGLRFYDNRTGTPFPINDIHTFTCTLADSKAGKILVQGPSTNDAPFLEMRLIGSRGKSTSGVISIDYEAIFSPPIITSPSTLEFNAETLGVQDDGTSLATLSSAHFAATDDPKNLPFETPDPSIHFDICLPRKSHCQILGSQLNATNNADGICVTDLTGFGFSSGLYALKIGGNCEGNVTATNKYGASSFPKKVDINYIPPFIPLDSSSTSYLPYIGFGVTALSIITTIGIRYFSYRAHRELVKFAEEASLDKTTVEARLVSKILNELVPSIPITKIGSNETKLRKWKSVINAIVLELKKQQIFYDATTDSELDTIALAVVQGMKFHPVLTKQTCCQKRCNGVCRRGMQPQDAGFQGYVKETSTCSNGCSCSCCGPVGYSEEEVDSISPLKPSVANKEASEVAATPSTLSKQEERRIKAERRMEAIVRKAEELLPKTFKDEQLRAQEAFNKKKDEEKNTIKTLADDLNQQKQALKAVNSNVNKLRNAIGPQTQLIQVSVGNDEEDPEDNGDENTRASKALLSEVGHDASKKKEDKEKSKSGGMVAFSSAATSIGKARSKARSVEPASSSEWTAIELATLTGASSISVADEPTPPPPPLGR